MLRILLMAPEAAERRRLRTLLEDSGFDVFEATSGVGARQAYGNRVRAVLADAQLLAEEDPIALAKPVPVVLIAGAPSVDDAVEAMRRGAADYLPWPCEPDRLVAAVRAAATGFATAVSTVGDLATIIGSSAPIRELKERILQAARANGPVLIQGEPGTGKALVAQVLHEASDRRYAPLTTLNCATTPEASIEPALFGYDLAPAAGQRTNGGLAGAAHGGTLLVKDIDLMPLAAQTRLLHLLGQRATPSVGSAPPETNVRVVATAHNDLRQLAANGHFFAELLDHLGYTTLRLPPLRDRGDDIARIAQSVLDRTASRLDKPGVEFTGAALAALRNHTWPGNVRELTHSVMRAVALCDASAIDADLLALATVEDHAARDLKPATSGSLEDFFVRFVIANQDQYTETELASQLGISRKSLWERRQRLNIPRRRTRKRGPRQPAAGL